MARSEDSGETLAVDLLVIGGGIAGIAAAIKAKEEHPDLDVLVVDKQTIGWSGKAPKGWGALWVMMPGDDVDYFMEYQVTKVGFHLNDQELLRAYAEETPPTLGMLSDWGINIMKDADGNFDTVKIFSSDWSQVGIDIDMMITLRARARKVGVKLLNKVTLVELLKQDGRITGAVGFDIIDGRFYTIGAKATILANGGQNFRVKRYWASGTGDGIAAAYRAGAEMRNAEYGNFYDTLVLDNYDTGLLVMDYLFNAQGENISEKYMPPPFADIDIGLVLGFEKETLEGRGPIYLDIPPDVLEAAIMGMGHWPRPKMWSWYSRAEKKVRKYGPPPAERPEVIMGLTGELAPVRVDHEMKTTLEGLWAIGDVSAGGASWLGAVPTPPGRLRGSGLMNALLSARHAVPSAADYAASTKAAGIDDGQVGELREQMIAPLHKDKGYSPAEALADIQGVMAPIKYNLRRSGDRLNEALDSIAKIQSRLPELYATDYHGLNSCHEVRAMADCAEMSYEAALARTETRGWHYREDYPERDDENWLKWVIVKKEEGKTLVTTEPVPIERYEVRP